MQEMKHGVAIVIVGLSLWFQTGCGSRTSSRSRDLPTPVTGERAQMVKFIERLLPKDDPIFAERPTVSSVSSRASTPPTKGPGRHRGCRCGE